MELTLKELRARAKELRSQVSGAPISKATKEQLQNEIKFYEKVAKADAAKLNRMEAKLEKSMTKSKPVKISNKVESNSEEDEAVPEKKKLTPKLVKKVKDTVAVPVQRAKKTKPEMELYDE